MNASQKIPVILFAYARAEHLVRALACLKENRVPLLYIFSDGAKGTGDAAAVSEVRSLLHGIDWCEVSLTERPQNLGLGRNVLAGVTEVAAKHEAFIVWEDDLICVPGTYEWLCAALQHYANDPRVMSVTGWTHPRLTPADVGAAPYFDGRAEGWVWGTWSRSWKGMNEPALNKLAQARINGIAPDTYGADLPEMAAVEQTKNIWAVRWCYHHLQHGGWCLRPPWSMVEHIGFDEHATNAAGDADWANPSLRQAPEVPSNWPDPKLNPACARFWQKSCPGPWRRRWNSLLRRLGDFLRA